MLERLSLRPRLFRLLKWLGWFFVAVWVLFGVSNLLLATRPVAGWFEGQISRRASVDCEVGRISWSPWNGVTLHGFRLAQIEGVTWEEEMVSVERVRILPYWFSLMRGRLQLREVELVRPEGAVALETLAMLSRPPARVVAARDGGAQSGKGTSPALAPQPGRSVSGSEDSKRGGAQPVRAGGEKQAGRQGDGVKKRQPGKGAARDGERVDDRGEAGLPLRLWVREGRLRLISSAPGSAPGSVLSSVLSSVLGSELVCLDGVELSLDLLGEDSTGQLKLGQIRVGDRVVAEGVEQDLIWRRPLLEWRSGSREMEGLTFQARLRWALDGDLFSKGVGTVGRMPFHFEVALGPQSVSGLPELERLGIRGAAERVEGRLSCSGLLRHPSSWRGAISLAGRQVRVSERHGGRDVIFDDLQVPLVFSARAAQWGGLRVVGEDVAILGNGRVSRDEGVVAVTRLVVSPEVAELVSRGLHGAGLSVNGQRWWQDLDTPDRKMRDILIWGPLIDPVIDLGPKHEAAPLRACVGRWLGFVRQEMDEQLLLLPPTQAGEAMSPGGEKE